MLVGMHIADDQRQPARIGHGKVFGLLLPCPHIAEMVILRGKIGPYALIELFGSKVRKILHGNARSGKTHRHFAAVYGQVEPAGQPSPEVGRAQVEGKRHNAPRTRLQYRG